MAFVEVPFLEAMMHKAVVVETRVLEAAILEPGTLKVLVSETMAVDEPRSAHVYLHAVQSRLKPVPKERPLNPFQLWKICTAS